MSAPGSPATLMTGLSPAHRAWSAARQNWSEVARSAAGAGDHETAEFAREVVTGMGRREPPGPDDPSWMHHLAPACSDGEVWDDEVDEVDDEELGR